MFLGNGAKTTLRLILRVFQELLIMFRDFVCIRLLLTIGIDKKGEVKIRII